MENLFLSIHNLMRWGILIVGFYAVTRAFLGMRGNKPYLNADNKSSLLFTLFCHMQLLLGIVMYFITSPFTQEAFKDFGAAMKDADLRFWAVEHGLMMLIAIVLVTIGRSKSKKALLAAKKHKTAFIFFGLALAIILLMMPWPFGAHPRPWFRF